MQRTVLALVLMVVASGVLTAAAWATTVTDTEDLLLSPSTLDAIGVTPGDDVVHTLPSGPACAAISQNSSQTEPAVIANVTRHSTDRRGDVVLDETVRVFRSTQDARLFVRPFRDEDPAEECVEVVMAGLVDDRGVVVDASAEIRTIDLGRARGVAYLADVTYVDGDREVEVRAEQIVGRSGGAVVEVFFVTPSEDFVEIATRVERNVRARLERARE